ncbi:MAG TPA: A24 family peptidase [Steroidobacteraceae bacterium]|nr:A24 family peptidase [Steroidobacteraceae bacterium]
MSVIALLAASPPLFIGTCLALGLVVGSFLNVVIHRLPLMLERQWREECAQYTVPVAGSDADTAAPRERYDLVVPRSACPACKAPITALQNIPLISWLALRGRCASCGQPIPVRYPLVEALTGVLSAAAAWQFGFGLPTVAALILTWFLIALTFIDLDRQLLPDSLTLPLLWLGLMLSLWGPQDGAPVPVELRSSVIGAAAGYASLWSVYHLFRLLTGKEGMGYGDFKLFAALGAWLGWQMLLPVMLIAAVTGAVVGIALLTLRGQNRATPIAFGPFLAAAGWLVLMFGHPLVERYFGLFTPHP